MTCWSVERTIDAQTAIHLRVPGILSLAASVSRDERRLQAEPPIMASGYI